MTSSISQNCSNIYTNVKSFSSELFELGSSLATQVQKIAQTIFSTIRATFNSACTYVSSFIFKMPSKDAPEAPSPAIEKETNTPSLNIIKKTQQTVQATLTNIHGAFSSTYNYICSFVFTPPHKDTNTSPLEKEDSVPEGLNTLSSEESETHSTEKTHQAPRRKTAFPMAQNEKLMSRSSSNGYNSDNSKESEGSKRSTSTSSAEYDMLSSTFPTSTVQASGDYDMLSSTFVPSKLTSKNLEQAGLDRGRSTSDSSSFVVIRENSDLPGSVLLSSLLPLERLEQTGQNRGRRDPDPLDFSLQSKQRSDSASTFHSQDF